ncbi:MAG: hypothetical protein ACFFCS_19930 [Candidatus Hodarchaeota archaeon]
MKINPQPTKFIIFSGGGGMIERVQKVRVNSGVNRIEIDNVPAAFDPTTTTVFFPEPKEGINLMQVDVKRPDKRIVDNFINRERGAASQIIQNATDLRGSNRDQIIQLIESAHYRRYEDMNGTIIVSLEANSEKEISLGIRYFIEDSRIKWEPSLHIKINEGDNTATIEGFILVMNNTDISYPQCQVGFAEFEMESYVGEEGYLDDLGYEQEKQSVMPKKRMMSNLKKMNALLM